MRCASALTTALVAWAGAASAATEAPHGASGGMPQLDPTYFVSQIFWLILAFALLYWFVVTRGAPRIADVLETRQDRIAADLDRAQALRGEAEMAMQKSAAMITEANVRARAQLAAAQERSAAEAERRERELDASLQHQLAEAERRIEVARATALAEIEVVAADVSRAASARLLGIDVAADDAARAVAALRGASPRRKGH